MGRPFISVVVTAYGRRDFLKYAVKSVINQTLDKGLYEIIVVKNFRDPPEIDRLIEDNRGKSIIMDAMSIGVKVAQGIRESEGEIVAFLEDDDVWINRKLEFLIKAFTNNDDLIYYHHNVYVINEKNQLINDELVELTNIYYHIKARTSQEKLAVFRKYEWHPGLRVSSMAIRKSAYEKYINTLRLLPDVIDVAIYALALTIPGLIMHEPGH